MFFKKKNKTKKKYYKLLNLSKYNYNNNYYNLFNIIIRNMKVLNFYLNIPKLFYYMVNILRK